MWVNLCESSSACTAAHTANSPAQRPSLPKSMARQYSLVLRVGESELHMHKKGKHEEQYSLKQDAVLRGDFFKGTYNY